MFTQKTFFILFYLIALIEALNARYIKKQNDSKKDNLENNLPENLIQQELIMYELLTLMLIEHLNALRHLLSA